MKITNEFINQLNKTIQISIQHGGETQKQTFQTQQEVLDCKNKESIASIQKIDEEDRIIPCLLIRDLIV